MITIKNPEKARCFDLFKQAVIGAIEDLFEEHREDLMGCLFAQMECRPRNVILGTDDVIELAKDIRITGNRIEQMAKIRAIWFETIMMAGLITSSVTTGEKDADQWRRDSEAQWEKEAAEFDAKIASQGDDRTGEQSGYQWFEESVTFRTDDLEKSFGSEESD